MSAVGSVESTGDLALQYQYPTSTGRTSLNSPRLHDRIPVLLYPEDYDQWLHGSFEEALSFQLRCFPDDLIEMTRTDELREA